MQVALLTIALAGVPAPQFREAVPVPQFVQAVPAPVFPIQQEQRPTQPADNGRWVSVCEGGVCRLQWVPYSTAPIQQPVVTPQYEYRRGLFGRTYRVQVR